VPEILYSNKSSWP